MFIWEADELESVEDDKVKDEVESEDEPHANRTCGSCTGKSSIITSSMLALGLRIFMGA